MKRFSRCHGSNMHPFRVHQGSCLTSGACRSICRGGACGSRRLIPLERVSAMFSIGNVSSTTGKPNPMNDFEVTSPPDDTVSCIDFSPSTVQTTFMVAGSWDGNVRLWEVQANGTTIPKDMKSHQAPILDCCWSDDGTKVFTGSCDKTLKGWDLNSGQQVNVGQHDAAIKTVHWIKAPNYTCIMTGSWDKSLKFWDPRSPNPMMTLQVPERVYCADVRYPMAVVSTANRGVCIYELSGQPKEYKKIDSSLKYQHRAIAIFPDKKGEPVGFALGSVEGRVAVQYVNPTDSKDNFTFKCHRSTEIVNGFQDIYAVNDVAFHPVHGTLATVGSDGRFSFWDKDQRTKLKTSDRLEQPITTCGFDASGQIFAYAVGYDWSKGHEHYDPSKKNHIFLHPCFEDMKPRPKS